MLLLVILVLGLLLEKILVPFHGGIHASQIMKKDRSNPSNLTKTACRPLLHRRGATYSAFLSSIAAAAISQVPYRSIGVFLVRIFAHTKCPLRRFGNPKFQGSMGSLWEGQASDHF